MGDDRPSVYVEAVEGGSVVVYRASALGDCLRALVATALDYEEHRPANIRSIMDTAAVEGDLHEEAVRDYLREDGWTIHSTQDVVEIPVIPGVIIRGHTDGVLSKKQSSVLTPDALLEVKSMSKDVFKKWMNGRFIHQRRYAWQISAYMKANPNRDVLYIAKDRNNGTLDIQIIPSTKPPVPWADIKKKIVTAERYRRKGELPPCDLDNQWGCPFFYLHDEAEEGEVPLDDYEQEQALKELVTEWAKFQEVERAGKEAEKERKALSDAVYGLIPGDYLTVEIDGEFYKVAKSGTTRTWVDVDAMRNDGHGELVDRYMRSRKSTYPLVTKLKRQPKGM